MHKAMHDYVRQLNQFYGTHPEFWQEDCDWSGFSWISCDDCDNSVIAFFRSGRTQEDMTLRRSSAMGIALACPVPVRM